MSESLLSFSNIDLFGHTLSELKIIDPLRPAKVGAAFAAHVPSAMLSGVPDVDGVKTSDGMRIPVADQKYHWRNGVYKVVDGSKWILKADKVVVGGAVLSLEGIAYKGNFWSLSTALDFPIVSASFPVTNRGDTHIAATLQININGIDIFVAPVQWNPGESKSVFVERIVEEINKELKESYYAESRQNVVTISVPTDNSAAFLDKEVKFSIVNLDQINTVKFSHSSEEETHRSFLPSGIYSKSVRKRRRGENRQLERQILKDSRFARIYGFSYEGTYYDLPRPTLFLVHGDGDLVTTDVPQDTLNPHPSRAPGATSLTGLGAADFDFADGLRVWSYDKADYTIRMDVETGMFEQVLLDAALDGPGGFDARGANVRGANARGANARGANVRGANARGANARGGGNSD